MGSKVGAILKIMKRSYFILRFPMKSENGLENQRGRIAMARGSYDPDSATSQFFINVNNNGSLNYQASPYSDEGYTVFGQVIKGMKVVDKIQKVRSSAAGPFRRYVPKMTIVIETVRVQNPLKPVSLNALSDDEPVATKIAEDILPTIQEEKEEKETVKASEMLTDSTIEIVTPEENTLTDSNSSSTAVSVDEIQEDTPVIAETENHHASQVEADSTSETNTADETLAKSSSPANAVLSLDEIQEERPVIAETENHHSSQVEADSTSETNTADDTLAKSSSPGNAVLSLDEIQEERPVIAETENHQASQVEADSTSETITAEENTLAENSSGSTAEDKPSEIFKKTETFKPPINSHIESIPLGEKTLTDSQARLAYVIEIEKETPSAALAEKEKYQALQMSNAYPLKTSFSAPDSPSTPDQPEPVSD
ncbi:Peptidylprolyl isomerase [Beggiatoa sp. SS]|nr:Peptidylprolyl isomerase [Beggiatoa sp. SS]